MTKLTDAIKARCTNEALSLITMDSKDAIDQVGWELFWIGVFKNIHSIFTYLKITENNAYLRFFNKEYIEIPDDKKTPLELAVALNNLVVMNALIIKGAIVNLSSFKYCLGPLHISVKPNYNLEIVKILLNKQELVNAVCDLIEDKINTDIVDSLDNQIQAEVKIKNLTALFYAVLHNTDADKDLIKLLCAHGASPNIITNFHNRFYTPFSLALEMGKNQLALEMLNYSVSVSEQYCYKETNGDQIDKIIAYDPKVVIFSKELKQAALKLAVDNNIRLAVTNASNHQIVLQPMTVEASPDEIKALFRGVKKTVYNLALQKSLAQSSLQSTQDESEVKNTQAFSRPTNTNSV